PESLDSLSRLSVLDLSRNELTALPRSLTKLKRLKFLDVRENPDLPIQPEILDSPRGSGDPADVISFYFRMGEMTRPLNEAKILLVGQGDVGKTSLVKRLLH